MPSDPSESSASSIALKLGITIDELLQSPPEEAVRSFEKLVQEKQADYEKAEGRVNKRISKKQLSSAQANLEAALLWQTEQELSSIIESLIELADAGSSFRANELLETHRGRFAELPESPLKERFQRIEKSLKESLRPTPPPEPEPEPEPSPEAGPSFDSKPETSYPEPEQQKSTPSKSKPEPEEPSKPSPTSPPAASCFTLELKNKERIHVFSANTKITFGRYGGNKSAVYELAAVVPKDKRETVRLLNMISGRHGSIINSNGQWGILDTWPDNEKPSTNGIFIEDVKLDSPVSFRRLNGKLLHFASTDPEAALPRFRIHVLETNDYSSPESILLERLDTFKDHILLLSQTAQLPSSFDSLQIARESEGFLLGAKKQQIENATRSILSLDSLSLTPFETVFYGREV